MIRTVTAALALVFAAVTAPPAEAATGDPVGVQNVWCGSAQRPAGASRYPQNFGGDRETACRKCDETARVLRAKGQITAWACEYVTPLGNYAVGWYRYV